MRSTKNYRQTIEFDERKKQANFMIEKNFDKVPVICEKHPNSKLDSLEKCKYLFYISLTSRYLIANNYKVFQFIHLLRNRINLKQEEALYLFVNGKILLKSESKLSEVYNQYKDSDGFLYIEYCEVNTFG